MTVQVKVWLALFVPSVAVMVVVKVLVLVLSGAPAMIPAAVLIERPSGRPVALNVGVPVGSLALRASQTGSSWKFV